MDKLQKLGFDDWLHNQLDESQTLKHDIARVIAVHKESYTKVTSKCRFRA
ncbi:MAG: hypothetical protein ACJA13_001227 [Paraglaciecola sp.]|jgi:hypothetical protein